MGARSMNWKLTATAVGLSLLTVTSAARADGELNIYNWGNYTSPDLIKKFEDDLQGQGHRHRLRFQRYRARQDPPGRRRLRHRRAVGQRRSDLDQRRPAAGDRSQHDGEFQERRSEMGRRAVRSGPQIHRAVAVGHDRHVGEQVGLFRRREHVRHLPRSAGRAGRQDQCRARDGRHHVPRHRL